MGSGAYGTVASFKDPVTGIVMTVYVLIVFRGEVRGEESAKCI